MSLKNFMIELIQKDLNKDYEKKKKKSSIPSSEVMRNGYVWYPEADVIRVG